MFFLYFFCYVSRLGSSKVILSVNQNSWNFTFSYFICPTRRLQLVKRVRANADALLQVAVLLLLLLFFSDFNQYSHEKRFMIEISFYEPFNKLLCCCCCSFPILTNIVMKKVFMIEMSFYEHFNKLLCYCCCSFLILTNILSHENSFHDWNVILWTL